MMLLLLISCNNLLQQADIRMRSHGLRQLVDEKSVASCQHTCCKLIAQLLINGLAASCFIIAARLILTGLLQPDEIEKFVATY